jgi:multiple sugar transport system substrate-binding protein
MSRKHIWILLLGVLGLSVLGLLSPVKAETKQDKLVFWTTETDPGRPEIIEDIASRFTGADVEVVGVDENDLPEQITTKKAAGELPDVVQIFYEFIGGYVDEGILDAERATTVIGGISDLGGLPLAVNPVSTGDDDMYGAVPIDGWVQGIWYRMDLFDEAGLDAPDSYDNIMAAAKALHNTTSALNPMYGIVIGTDPKAVYTQQVYEHFALANGARALDKDGNVVLDSELQLEALEYYAELAQYAPKGFNNWDAANQLYLTGKCAMMVYSTYIADDILGLQEREWAPVADLGENTGFQAAIEGKHGDVASYGQLGALGITEGAHAEAENFIKFILNTDAEYLKWIHMAITGKMPLKQTTAILANWTQHEVWGSYEEGLAESILEGFKNVGRWGLIDGNSYSTKVDTLYGELIIPKAINKVIANTTTAEVALQEAEADFLDALGEAPTATPGFEVLVFFGGLFTLVVLLRKRRK